MLRPKVCIFGLVSDNIQEASSEKAECHFYQSDYNLSYIQKNINPEVYVTLGNVDQFQQLMYQPLNEREKWLHYDNDREMITKFNEILYCFISNVCQTHPDDNSDLISLFTTSYKSKDFIMRPFTSLIKQTYQNWEWVILDDTEGDENFETLKKIKALDPKNRIRIYRSDGNSGVIGEVKNTASSLCRGSILIELDHDDELTADALQLCKEAFDKYPDADFVYSDFTEVFEDWSNFSYGDFFSHGYGGYRKEYYNNRWVNICSSPPINDKTLRHIVGAPNHFRAWRSSFFRRIGGYNTHLHVADDYELLIRTFLYTRMVRLPKFCYVQYRNKGGNNFTFIRNSEIQKLVKVISRYYTDDIHQRLVQLKLPDRCHWTWSDDQQYWTHPNYDIPANYFGNFFISEDFISVVIPTYNRPSLLKRAINSVLQQTHQHFEIIVIGDHCPEMENIMENYQDPRIKWWNLEDSDNSGGTAPRNYALKIVAIGNFIAYLDDDNYWLPNHLETLINKFRENPKIQYAFSSFEMGDYTIICREPKRGRIDTSAILHRTQLLHKYGYWKRQDQVGYAHDWELVSRWKMEPYAATGLPTLKYNTETCGQDAQAVYEMYPDQQVNAEIKVSAIIEDLSETESEDYESEENKFAENKSAKIESKLDTNNDSENKNKVDTEIDNEILEMDKESLDSFSEDKSEEESWDSNLEKKSEE